MTSTNGNAGPGGAPQTGGSEDCQVGRRDASEYTDPTPYLQARYVTRAELVGSDTCTAAGLTVTAYAPVLVLCRSLIAAGMSPDQAMECWRGSILALRIRSIGAAAGLEISGDGVGFRRTRQPDAAPPMRLNRGVAR